MYKKLVLILLGFNKINVIFKYEMIRAIGKKTYARRRNSLGRKVIAGFYGVKDFRNLRTYIALVLYDIVCRL